MVAGQYPSSAAAARNLAMSNSAIRTRRSGSTNTLPADTPWTMLGCPALGLANPLLFCLKNLVGHTRIARSMPLPGGLPLTDPATLSAHHGRSLSHTAPRYVAAGSDRAPRNRRRLHTPVGLGKRRSGQLGANTLPFRAAILVSTTATAEPLDDIDGRVRAAIRRSALADQRELLVAPRIAAPITRMVQMRKRTHRIEGHQRSPFGLALSVMPVLIRASAGRRSY